MAPREIFHLDLDAFFASVEQVRNPTLRGRPVVVGGTPDQRGVVHSASYEARRLGIHTGMPLRQAARLCPQAVFLQGTYLFYREFWRVAREVMETFTPDVEAVSLDEAYLDLTGLTERRGGTLAAAEALRGAIVARTGLSASIGIASNRLLAKVASDAAKPRGILRVLPGAEAAVLGPCDVSLLPGVGSRGREALARVNVRTVAGLRALPREYLVATFGEARGHALWNFARGVDTRPVAALRAPRSVSRETTFRADTNDAEEVASMLHYLVERAGLRLRTLGLAAGRFEVRVRYGDDRSAHANGRLAPPSDLDAEIYRQARPTLDRLLERRAAVRHVGVTVSSLVPAAAQMELLPAGGSLSAEALSRSIDRVRHAFGFNALTVGASIDLLGRLDKESTNEGGFRLNSPALTQ